MGTELRPISLMQRDVEYNRLRLKGLLPDPRPHIRAKIQELEQDQKVITEVDQLAKNGIAELSSLSTELTPCVRSRVADIQVTHEEESVEDLQAINSNGRETLAKAKEHLHTLIEKTQLIRNDVKRLEKTHKKQAEGGQFCSFLQGAGNQAVHHIATKQGSGKGET